LRDKGIDCKCLKLDGRLTVEQFAREIISRKERIVGFSVFDDNINLVLDLAALVKAHDRSITVIGGGPSVIRELAEKVFREYSGIVDYFLEGPAERSLPLLIDKCHSDHGRLDEIEGLFYWRDNEIVSVPHTDKEIDFNDYSSPYLSRTIPEAEYPHVGVISSRCCCYKCTFCNCAFSHSWPSTYYDDDRFVDEITLLSHAIRDHGEEIDFLPIWDDTFSTNIIRAKRILQRLIRLKMGIKLWCQTRVDKVDRELLEMMKAAGIVFVNVGLESASLHVLKTIKKARLRDFDKSGYEPEKEYLDNFRKVRKWCYELDLGFSVYTILGLPNEKFEDGLETMRFLRKLRPDHYKHNILTLYTGTEITRNYSKYGYTIKEAFDETVPLACSEIEYPYDVMKVPPLPYRLIDDKMKLLEGNNVEQLKRLQGLAKSGVTVVEAGCESNNRLETFDNIYYDQTYCVKDAELSDIGIDTYVLPDGVKYRQIAPYFVYDNMHDNKLFYFEIPYRKLNGFLSSIDAVFAGRRDYGRYSALSNAFILIRMNDAQDMDALCGDARTLKYGGRLNLPDNLLNLQFHGYHLMDSCKWSNRCPILERNRIVVSHEGKYKTCYHGVELCSVWDGIEGSYHKLTSIMAAQEKRRKCSQCSASDNCSKCCSVLQNEELYCSCRRDNIDPTELISLLNIINYNFLNPLKKRKTYSRNYLLCKVYRSNKADECKLMLLTIGRKKYLMVKKSDAPFYYVALSRAVADIIELLWADMKTESIIKLIQKNNSVAMAAALEDVERAEAVIKENISL